MVPSSICHPSNLCLGHFFSVIILVFRH
uniref:Uncharacterized protein n=1 Tax=Rhizophora mucronata TaxID=61149 RepID=A0A2P2PM25_RHIMU